MLYNILITFSYYILNVIKKLINFNNNFYSFLKQNNKTIVIKITYIIRNKNKFTASFTCKSRRRI